MLLLRSLAEASVAGG